MSKLQKERAGEAAYRHGHAGKWRKHGESPTYKAWLGMRSRCTHRSRPDFKYYGGRGVTYCERWNSFINFLDDMGEVPKGLTLDRIDPYGRYEPTNCRWATRQQQADNQRRFKEE